MEGSRGGEVVSRIKTIQAQTVHRDTIPGRRGLLGARLMWLEVIGG